MLQHCQTSHLTIKLDFPAPAASNKVVRRRFIRSINKENWKSDLKECLQTLDQPSDVNTAGVSLDAFLRALLDKYTPEVTRISVLQPNVPWFNSHLQELKRTKRQCERKFIFTRLGVHRQIYREQCAIYLAEINAAKSDYYSNKTMEKDPNQLGSYYLIDGLFHVKKEKPLPTCDCTTNIAQQFSLFFASKIEKPRADIPTQVHVHNPTRSTTVISMHHFEHVSEDLVSRILRKSPSKSCSAYCSNHSTEKALLRVVSDIQRSINDHKEVILVLLDLSSAFDTLDHTILLGRLRDYYSIYGTVLRWLESYLSGRSKTVVINMPSSDERQLVSWNSTRVRPWASVVCLNGMLYAFQFPALESHGISLLVMESRGKL